MVTFQLCHIQLIHMNNLILFSEASIEGCLLHLLEQMGHVMDCGGQAADQNSQTDLQQMMDRLHKLLTEPLHFGTAVRALGKEQQQTNGQVMEIHSLRLLKTVPCQLPGYIGGC
ncbi:hypothetical protein D3C75_839700 [compost metagenome]